MEPSTRKWRCLAAVKCATIHAINAVAAFPFCSWCGRWGWNGGNVRHKSWTNAALQESLAKDEEFQTSIGTWREQRAFLTNALAALPPSSRLARDVRAAYDEIWRGGDATSDAADTHARRPLHSFESFRAAKHANAEASFNVVGAGDTVQCGAFEMAFDDNGAISMLRTSADSSTNASWADEEHTIAHVWYMGMDRKYFADYVDACVCLPYHLSLACLHSFCLWSQ